MTMVIIISCYYLLINQWSSLLLIDKMSDDPYDPYDVNVYAKPNKNPIQKEIFEEEKDLGPDKPTGKMNKKTNVFNPYENKNATFTPIEDREESEENRPTLKRKKTDEELPENIDLTSSAYDPKKLAKKAREARKADAIGNNGDGIGDDIDEEDEPPLLEELGINPLNIKNKIISILMLQKIDKKSLEDSDMAGPFLVFMLFVFSLVLQKKFWFSYLYGISVFGSIMLFLLMNLMNKVRYI